MIVCMASGEGTNFENLVKHGIKIDLVISNNKNAKVLDKATKSSVQCITSVKDYELHVPEHTTIVILAGFMRILSKEFVNKHKVVNIHPSLLPSFRGKDAVLQALNAGVKLSGCTVHWVDEGMDTGKIIEQASCPVWEDDTVASLHKRIHSLEHKIFPEAIHNILRTI